MKSGARGQSSTSMFPVQFQSINTVHKWTKASLDRAWYFTPIHTDTIMKYNLCSKSWFYIWIQQYVLNSRFMMSNHLVNFDQHLFVTTDRPIGLSGSPTKYKFTPYIHSESQVTGILSFYRRCLRIWRGRALEVNMTFHQLKKSGGRNTERETVWYSDLPL